MNNTPATNTSPTTALRDSDRRLMVLTNVKLCSEMTDTPRAAADMTRRGFMGVALARLDSPKAKVTTPVFLFQRPLDGKILCTPMY